jgi:hydroxyacylglutathione hydrolase
MRVSDQLYLYLWHDQRENNCNSIVIDGKTPTLIDPGHLHRVDNLLQRMREDGFDPEKIKVVICTHAHPDHFEGTTAFAKSSVKIGLSRQEERFIEEVGRPMYVQQGMTMPEFRVDFYLREGTLNLGKHEFEILLTPGHSPGSICLYWPRYRVLVGGDVVFMRGVGRADLPGGDANTLKRTLQRLSELPIELLIPGHGPPIQGSDQVQANFEFVKRAYFSAL